MKRSVAGVAVGLVAVSVLLAGCARGGSSGGEATEGGSSFPDGEVIEVIVPYDAGGVTDVIVRLVVEGVSEELGSPVQVINKPGASGSVGLSELATSDPDGLMIGSFNLPSGFAYLDPTKSLPYTIDSFTPIAGLALSPTVIAVREDAPWETFEDLVAAAEDAPGQITLAGSPNATSDDTLAVSALEQGGVDFNVVTSDAGGADRVTQLLGGQMQVLVGSLGTIQPAVQSGQARILAVATQERPELLSDVPTLTELGYDVNTSGYISLAAPAGVDADAVDIIAKAVATALEDPELITAASTAGYEIVYRDPTEIADFWAEQEAATRTILGLD